MNLLMQSLSKSINNLETSILKEESFDDFLIDSDSNSE